MLYNYLIRYPFSKKGKLFLENHNIDLLSVSKEDIKKAAYFLLRTIPQNQIDKEKQWHNYLSVEDENVALFFVKLYPICRILLKVVDYNPLYQQFANHFQKQLIYFLNKPLNNKEFDSILEDICPNLKYDSLKDKYFISIVSYLFLELGEDYKLQYMNLENGFIFLKKEELIDFFGIIIKKNILKNIDSKIDSFPKLFIDYGNSIKDKVLNENTFNVQIINKPEISSFPPCFLKMYNNLISGNKLTHIENFTLAVFLSNIGYTFDEILELYKNLPNFDKKIAGYQIQKLIEKKYSVPNCDTLKSNGLCINECKVKHPFQLFKKKR
ncbi:MAG: hypothetical protein PHN22_03790 [Candidatus ainarchaeum sp.]|nr:hypothetical protein [Candidatus ainarchaeum sp.]